MARTLPPSSDIIAAVATPPGRGGVGVVRVSASTLGPFVEAALGRSLKARTATLCDFRAADASLIDQGLALFFPSPNSYTGEDVLELQGHGGPIVMQLLLQRCLELGARAARPGEFSERAFLNGKLDLAQAEAVADLIDASTAAAARSAVRSLQGEFSAAISKLIETLLALRILVEAALDFPDEEIDILSSENVFSRLDAVTLAIDDVFRRAQRGQLLRDGLQVVLVGQPNVGKSSLLNRLAGDELAIVSDMAGTTRDSLRSTIQVRGMPLHIIDTAGLRDSEDAIEQLGMARTLREIERADVALVVADARFGLAAADQAIIDRLPPELHLVIAFNKCDLIDTPPASATPNTRSAVLMISATRGDGLPEMEEALLQLANWHPGEDSFVARERHLAALRCASGHLRHARQQAARFELLAEELRLAHQSLQQITGEYTPDDLLGEIFSSFCIGK